MTRIKQLLFMIQIVIVGIASGLEATTHPGSEVEMSGISGDRESPRRHFRLRDPAKFGPEQAESIYQIAVSALSTGYVRSDNPSARVDYCIACHLAAEHQDHLYFIPPAYRNTMEE